LIPTLADITEPFIVFLGISIKEVANLAFIPALGLLFRPGIL